MFVLKRMSVRSTVAMIIQRMRTGKAMGSDTALVGLRGGGGVPRAEPDTDDVCDEFVLGEAHDDESPATRRSPDAVELPDQGNTPAVVCGPDRAPSQGEGRRKQADHLAD